MKKKLNQLTKEKEFVDSLPAMFKLTLLKDIKELSIMIVMFKVKYGIDLEITYQNETQNRIRHSLKETP